MRAAAERVGVVTSAAVLVGAGVGSGTTTLYLTSILRVSSPVPHRLGDPTRTDAKDYRRASVATVLPSVYQARSHVCSSCHGNARRPDSSSAMNDAGSSAGTATTMR
jgi:hypothetical protein